MLILIAILLSFACSANASWYIYYSHQSEKHIRETGQVKGDGYNKGYLLYEDDLDRHFSGIALEYRHELNKDFSLAPGFLYQDALHVQQRTTTYGPSVDCGAIDDGFCVAGASRDDMVHITYHHLYLNGYYHINEEFSLLAAPVFTMPDVNNHGRFEGYRIKNGLGFQGGVEANLPDNFVFQVLWRQLTLDTYDKNIDYDGDRALDTFLFNIGYKIF